VVRDRDELRARRGLHRDHAADVGVESPFPSISEQVKFLFPRGVGDRDETPVSKPARVAEAQGIGRAVLPHRALP